MHEFPRQKLRDILVTYGASVCEDPRRLEGLLKDVLRNEFRRETFVLVSALNEEVAHDLKHSRSGMPPNVLAGMLARRLYDTLGFDHGVARWAVESWAFALNIDVTSPQEDAPGKPQLRKTSNLTRGMPPEIPEPATPTFQNRLEVDTVGQNQMGDLAAMVLQQLQNATPEELKAREERKSEAQAEAVQKQLDDGAKARACRIQKKAREVAYQHGDFAEALRMLDEIDPKYRNHWFYDSLCSDRDKISTLDSLILAAVNKGHLLSLREMVNELLKLQPHRDDMRRLLEVLPE